MRDVYESRHCTKGEIAERQDPIVWGSLDGPLSGSQVEQFERDGFIILHELFAHQEVERLLEEAHRLAANADAMRDDEVITEPDSDVVRSVFRIHQSSPVFRAVCADARLHRAARQILGSEVYIHQSRINFKPGFDGREFYWHSDFETWHIEDGMPRMRALSASILLVDNSVSNGPLMLVPGSHRAYVRCVGQTPADHHKESLKAQRYGVPSKRALSQLIEDGGITQAVANAGSVVLFDCNVMHGSAGNLSPYPRDNIFVVYNSVDNPLERPFGGLEPRPSFLGERAPKPLCAN